MVEVEDQRIMVHQEEVADTLGEVAVLALTRLEGEGVRFAAVGVVGV